MIKTFTRRLLPSLLLLALPLIFLLSCQREISLDPSLTPPVPKNMTVEGVITNEAGLPLKDVTIKAGNVQVVGNASATPNFECNTINLNQTT